MRYNQRFQELALTCVRTCPEESDRVERYIGGLLDSIHRSVAASKPKTMQEATEMATGLMDKKIRTYAERHATNKRKSPTNANVANNQRGNGASANVANNQRGNRAGQKVTCYECRAQGHFKRSFVSTAFSSQFDIAPTVLDHDYAVELADGRIVGVNTVIRSCTLNFLNHPFNIDLMPVEMGSVDVIISIDWSNQEHEARLNIISCAKTQKYMLKGCQVFLAHVTTKEAEGKLEKKLLENVPIAWDFPEVFPEDLPGLPPT
nr:putative reverse transcriptase domain-containing protein [Tanacetum cinerariifolium]